jgi:hypothetical protein
LAFLRFTRDKRGYEHFYLVEATTNRRGKTKARVLYWFRTPPGVKVGREPFDPDVRRALELQNPGVDFDWRKIVETPIPSADVERWRERRRLERTERARRRGVGLDDAQRPQEFQQEFHDRCDSGSMENGDAEGEVPGHADAIDVTEHRTSLGEDRSEIAESRVGDVDDVLDEFGEPRGIESGESADLTVDAAEQQADALAPTEDSLVSAAASIEPDEVLSGGVALADANKGEAPSGVGNAQLPSVGTWTHEFRRRRRRRRRHSRGQGGPPRPPGD